MTNMVVKAGIIIFVSGFSISMVGLIVMLIGKIFEEIF